MSSDERDSNYSGSRSKTSDEMEDDMDDGNEKSNDEKINKMKNNKTVKKKNTKRKKEESEMEEEETEKKESQNEKEVKEQRQKRRYIKRNQILLTKQNIQTKPSGVIRYTRGGKRRQQFIVNNHALMTAMLAAAVNYYYDLEISYPIRVAKETVIFPRIRQIFLELNDSIDVSGIVRKRIQVIKQEKRINDNDEDARINYESHYEIYHFLLDFLTLISDIEVEGVIEEHGGLSGEYEMKFKGRVYDVEEIDTRGREIVERLYGNRRKGEKRRVIKQGELNDLLFL